MNKCLTVRASDSPCLLACFILLYTTNPKFWVFVVCVIIAFIGGAVCLGTLMAFMPSREEAFALRLGLPRGVRPT